MSLFMMLKIQTKTFINYKSGSVKILTGKIRKNPENLVVETPVKKLEQEEQSLKQRLILRHQKVKYY